MKIKSPTIRIEFYKELDEGSINIYAENCIELYTDKFILQIPLDEEIKKVLSLPISTEAMKVEISQIIYRKYNNEYFE